MSRRKGQRECECVFKWIRSDKNAVQQAWLREQGERAPSSAPTPTPTALHTHTHGREGEGTFICTAFMDSTRFWILPSPFSICFSTLSQLLSLRERGREGGRERERVVREMVW